MDHGGDQGYRGGNEGSSLPSMITVMLISLILVGLTIFGLAAVRFGADSRPVFDERLDHERFGALR
jgi:hypothetical protein